MYPILLVPAFLNVFVIAVWWKGLSRLGFAGEVIGREPNMLPLDVVSVFLASMVGYLALHAWSGYELAFFGPLPQDSFGTSTLATICCLASMAVTAVNSGDRFTVPTVAGLRESGIRTLLTLRIIGRAEEIQKRSKK